MNPDRIEQRAELKAPGMPGQIERSAARRTPAPVFAALGDGTRLRLLGELGLGRPRSISELTAGSELTRQAITKHLRVLERAGLVRGERRGRERRFALTPQSLTEARRYLDRVSEQGDQALARLTPFVETAAAYEP